MSLNRVLLADDDASVRLVLQQALTREGFNVRATNNLSTLAKWVRDGEGDIVVSDVYMGDESLFDALSGLKAARPDLPFIVMSGQNNVLTALSAAGGGAYDYVPKPFDLDDLVGAVRRALVDKPDAKSRASAAAAEKEERLPLIGRSGAMQEVYRILARVAATDLTVLIEGEFGAGKERVARALHGYSRRKDYPFVFTSVAGATGDSLETTLRAKCAEAMHGVLYISGLDDLPIEGQARLARLLAELEADPSADLRLIVASQTTLADLAAAGQFRRDLLFRFNVAPIRLPPLRERLEDVADLARAFLVRARREGLPHRVLDQSAIEALRRHDWPGNVRELENLLRRAAALRPETVITGKEIEAELVGALRPAGAGADHDDLARQVVARVRHDLAAGSTGELYDKLLADVERPMIETALEVTRGNQIRAAGLLGINRNTLRKKIQQLGIPTGRDD
jgi:two-component system, NtrC family, nitrogen regulation response regulator GlnG